MENAQWGLQTRSGAICVAFRPYVCAFDAAAPVRAGEFHRQHKGGAGGPQAPEARAQAERATMSLKGVDFQSKSSGLKRAA